MFYLHIFLGNLGVDSFRLLLKFSLISLLIGILSLKFLTDVCWFLGMYFLIVLLLWRLIVLLLELSIISILFSIFEESLFLFIFDLLFVEIGFFTLFLLVDYFLFLRCRLFYVDNYVVHIIKIKVWSI